MLQVKVKHIEEGISFSRKRTKVGRSQGRKVHITIEKEYSRYEYLHVFFDLEH